MVTRLLLLLALLVVGVGCTPASAGLLTTDDGQVWETVPGVTVIDCNAELGICNPIRRKIGLPLPVEDTTTCVQLYEENGMVTAEPTACTYLE